MKENIKSRLRELLPDATEETLDQIIALFEEGEAKANATPPGTPPPSGGNG